MLQEITNRMAEEKEKEYTIEIILSERFKRIIDYFSINYNKEIAGFITGEVKDNRIIAEDLIFPEQSTSCGSVNFNGSSLAKLRSKEGDKCLRIIGEWHSHNSMGCFWSTTDIDEFIEPFSKDRDISLFIVSSKGEDLVRLEIRKPLKISIDKIDYYVECNKEICEECERIIKEKVVASEEIICITKGKNKWNYNNWDKEESEMVEDFEKLDNKHYRELVKNHFTLENEKTIKIYDVNWDVADRLSVAYQNFKNHMTFGVGNVDSCNLYIEFKDRGEALSNIKFIKNWLEEEFREYDKCKYG